MRTRVAEYKITLSGGYVTVHLKKPSGITLGTLTPIKTLTVATTSSSTLSLIYDSVGGYWKEELALLPIQYHVSHNGTNADANPSVGDSVYILNPEEQSAAQTIGEITYITPPTVFTLAAEALIKESIRLIFDEDAIALLCSTATKENIESISVSSETGYGIALQFAIPSGYTITANDAFTIAMDWGTQPEELAKQETLTAILALLQSDSEDIPEDVPEGVNEKLVLIMQYLGVPASISYTPLTQAEVIASTRAEQVNAWGEDGCPIPNYLPTGVTEAMVEAAATALGITYYEPNFNIATL